MNDWMRLGEVWKWFGLVCSIPHPSHHERALRARLDLSARNLGLKTRTDAAGNLRIDRPAQAGFEALPAVILEAHLDMVPQAAAGVDFDFTRDAIEAVVEDGKLTTGGRTTLGGDDGFGLALAMTLLADPSSYRGRLSALFTVSEETGLEGAAALDPAFLDGDFLLGLDAGGEKLVAGCYGGKRFDAVWNVDAEATAPGDQAFTVTLDGLHGGHSGVDIDRDFGNAVRELAALLGAAPGVRIAGFQGGSADNAIPRSASAVVVTDAGGAETLKKHAAEREKTVFPRYRKEGAEPHFTITPAALPERCWNKTVAAAILKGLTETGDGVLKRDAAGAIQLSCNLGIAGYDAGKNTFSCCFLARSMDNAEKTRFAEDAAAQLRSTGAAVAMSGEYSGWIPRPGGMVTKLAAEVYRRRFGREPQLIVEKGGLETGIFSGKRPELEMLAFGPRMGNLHSPSEWLDVASVDRVEQFLRELLRELEKTQA